MENANFSDVYRRQYDALFAMLEGVIERCPAAQWEARPDGEAPLWQQAMHTLFSLNFYLADTPSAVRHELFYRLVGEDEAALEAEPERARQCYRDLLAALMHPTSAPAAPLPQADVLAYARELREKSARVLSRANLHVLFEQETTFPWTGPTVADKHLYSIRHAQHHVGRLSSLLSRQAGVGAKWLIFVEDTWQEVP